MAFHIKNRETEALARKVAALKGVGLTEAVHDALRKELEREEQQPDLIERSIAFAKALRARGRPDLGKPADKDFIDSLYEDD
jgi:antitoxin VapB